ncbi:hypothetical protein F1559_003579 [Cyanidiococcus yangmingshanensis]|uniref:Uncharacterized protein n=1 Tax=Cyanidiococcus yangmingshanensis TaxID=2690220 RepID=A0A7J7IMC6_9RHOD|nr:hypothetical protein F1559_003579 [Cyanidiococcus yangmingshanensis]
MEAGKQFVYWRERLLALEGRLDDIEMDQEELHRIVEDKERLVRDDLEALEDALLGKFRALVAYLRQESEGSSLAFGQSTLQTFDHGKALHSNEGTLKVDPGYPKSLGSELAHSFRKQEACVGTPTLSKLYEDKSCPRWANSFSRALLREKNARMALENRIRSIELTVEKLLNTRVQEGSIFDLRTRFYSQQNHSNPVSRTDTVESPIQAYISRVIWRIEHCLTRMGAPRMVPTR